MKKDIKLRRIIFYLVLILVVVFLIVGFHQIRKFTSLVSQLNLFILSTIIIIRIIYYYANAKYFQKFFKIFSHKKIAFKQLFIITIVMNFINTVLPSAGVSGTAYLAKATDKKIKASTATISQVSWYVLTFIAYLIILLFGLISLFLSNQIAKVSFRVVTIIVIFLAIACFVAAAIALNRKLTKKICYLMMKPINLVLRWLKKPAVSKKDIARFVDEFYHNAGYLLKDPIRLKSPFVYCLLGLIMEIASIYIVFLSFGKIINPGVVISGYSLAMLSSLAALLTSGVGVYEATMVAAFVGLGQPFALSLSVVLVYRVIAFWLFIPIGLFFYKRQIDGKD